MEIDPHSILHSSLHDHVVVCLTMFNLLDSFILSLESTVTQTCSLIERSIHFMKLVVTFSLVIKQIDAGVFSGSRCVINQHMIKF